MDADLKEIELDYQMPATPIQVRGDAALLSRVFQNLVLNAIESTPRLGFVGIEVEAVGDRARVIVSDSGPGIPGHVMRRLTDPAALSISENGVRPNGRGLGLIFVRRALELHGGRIVAEPGHEEGSRLVVELSLTAISSLAARSAE
jgi:signal transduction histidine kinase